MSGRPPRKRERPNRFVPGQGKVAPGTVGVGKKRKRSNAVASAPRGVLPKRKDKLIPLLIPLISRVTSDVDLQHFLISIYDETSNDEYTKSMFGGETEDEAKRKIAVHVDLFSKKLYRGSQPQMSFTLKGDDMINLAYLMYLDMLHDETIKKDMTFKTFCKENIEISVKVPAPTNNDKKATKMEKKTQRSPVYILFGTGLKPKETDFIKTIQSVVGKDKAEASIKANLPSIYPDILKKETTIRKDQVSSRILTPGHNMFLSVDQEDEKATVTLDIQRTKYQLSNGTEGKIMYPLVSVANLMDPGRDMLIESAKEDSKYFMLGLNNRDIRSRLTWNYKQPKFTINHDNGSTTIGAYYTNEARITNNPNKNRKTKRGYAYLIKNKKGEYRFPSNMTKAKAQTGSTGEKIAKFLGDFLQALTVVSYIKNNDNPNYHYCLATGDAMLANNFIFLCSRSGVSPNLWMATSTKQVSKVYGEMIEYIRIVKPAPTEVMNAPNASEGTGNKNQEASSGNNRTEGGGNTNNKNNRGILRRIFGGNKKPANSGTVNKKPVNNSAVNKKPVNNNRNVRRMNVNNASSVAGSSRGSVSRNNNNNNVTSNNQRGQRINVTRNNQRGQRINVTRNNQRGQRINVTRNNQRGQKINVTRNNGTTKNIPNPRKVQFIKNLNKFTSLSQRFKRGYIQNFNNGINANKLLREAKNENNKLKIAATSIRKESLRKPNPEGRMTMFGFRK
jgi:hypothetical protein